MPALLRANDGAERLVSLGTAIVLRAVRDLSRDDAQRSCCSAKLLVAGTVGSSRKRVRFPRSSCQPSSSSNR